MPYSSDIHFLVQCPSCCKVYKSPKILRCLHTFCEACIHKLTKLSAVRCPQCSVVTKLSEVLSDFRMQTWIDLYLKTRQRQQDQDGLASLLKTSNYTATIAIPSAPTEVELQLSLHDYESNLYSNFASDHQVSLVAIQKHKYESCRKILDFEAEKASRLTVIRDELWVIMDSGRICTLLLDNDNVLYEMITIDEEHNSIVGYVTRRKSIVTYKATAVTEMRNTDIIVVCDGAIGLYNGWMYKNYGLFHINKKGCVQCCISSGRYVDVTNNNDFIYALRAETPQSIVEVHYYNSQTIQCVNVLHFNIMSPSFRILALPDCLYMTSQAGNENKMALCRQKMNLGSADLSPPEFIQTTTSKLNHVLLACVDMEGTLMIVDKDSSTVAVKDEKDRFRKLDIQSGAFEEIMDATIWKQDKLFVIARNTSSKLSTIYHCA